MKIGMLTSGGDCQGLNAALRGVAKALYQEFGTAVTIYGIRDGYRGLIEGDYHPMEPQDFSDILTRGGTILGTSRQPFKTMQQAEENEATKLEKMLDTCRRARFDCLVILGGNGTHKTANLLSEHGIPVVTLPKTIDNDLWGTQVTFGFQSAMNIAVEVIDSIHSTAFSHSRVFIVEIMGHKAGWLTLHAGIASGADGRIDGIADLVAGVGGGRDDPVKPLLAHELLHDQLGHGAAADISGADEHDSNHWLADPFSDGSIGTTSTTVSRPSETVK